MRCDRQIRTAIGGTSGASAIFCDLAGDDTTGYSASAVIYLPITDEATATAA
jgi:hypothetical protein